MSALDHLVNGCEAKGEVDTAILPVCICCSSPERCRGEEICHYTGSYMLDSHGKPWEPSLS